MSMFSPFYRPSEADPLSAAVELPAEAAQDQIRALQREVEQLRMQLSVRQADTAAPAALPPGMARPRRKPDGDEQ